jgi:ribosomal protein S18 acetylase RimI-like enzyme
MSVRKYRGGLTFPWLSRGRGTTARSANSSKLARVRRAPSVTELSPCDFVGRLDQLMAVYVAAMRPSAELLTGRKTIMAGHAANPGFRALAVIDGGSGEPVGFGYGFHGAAGQWWHDTVEHALAASRGEQAVAAWLDDSFEVAELHVAPGYQGRGIGTDVLHGLASGRPERTALLSTPDTDSPARRLYRRSGFTDLLTGFLFPGGDPPYAVMGAVLPLRAPGSRSPRPSR